MKQPLRLSNSISILQHHAIKTFFFLFLLTLINLKAFAIPNPSPVIIDFTPKIATPGSIVIINGNGFGTTLQTAVYFGGVKATILISTPTLLTVTVPYGANYSTIEVINTNNNLSARSKDFFTPLHNLNISGNIADSFAPVTGLPATGSKPSNFTFGDFDLDGKPDLVVVNDDSDDMFIYKNNSLTAGNPNFELVSITSVSQSPQGVKLGDVNGDGKLDIIVASYNGTFTNIFINNSVGGTISFNEAITIPATDCPFYADLVDMDGDGKADIVLASKLANTVQIIRNTSSGNNVSFSGDLSLSDISQTYVISIADMDGDNKQDIVAAAFGSNEIYVFKNTSVIGTLSFAAPVVLEVPTPYGVTLADLDGDGKLDIISSNLMQKNISIFKNTTTDGTISFTTREDIAIGKKVYATAVGDLNGDGKLDLAVTSYYIKKNPIDDQEPEDVIQDPSGIVILKNNSTIGNIQLDNQGELLTGKGPYAVGINDINSDGKNEIISVNYEDDSMTIYTSGTPLPVAFNIFKAVLVNNSEISLSWDTFSENRNSHFNILSSVDGVNFNLLKTVSGNGTKATHIYYNTIDAAPAQGYNYYKLQQVDVDGTVVDLSIQVVKVSLAKETLIVYPNPMADMVSIQFEEGAFTKIEVLDLNSRVLEVLNIVAGTNQASFNVARLNPAVYVIRLSGAGGTVNKSFIKK